MIARSSSVYEYNHILAEQWFKVCKFPIKVEYIFHLEWNSNLCPDIRMIQELKFMG